MLFLKLCFRILHSLVCLNLISPRPQPIFFQYPFIFSQQIVTANVPPEDQDGSGDDSDNFSGSGTGKTDPEH